MAYCMNFVALYILFQAIASCQCMEETQIDYEQHKDASPEDFFLGGLFPIHSSLNTCDSISTQIPGVEYAEAMLFALDSVNNDTTLLPNLTLGYDIRDTCSVDYVAIDESTKWVTNKIAQSSCDCLVSSSSQDTDSLLVAVIGAAFSKVSAPVASVLRPFGIPQISYASTSSELNDRQTYSYFLRTVPPDSLQAAVIVSILQEMDWTVVSAIHSNELYGETGMEEFRKAIDNTTICMDLDESIDETFSDADYSALANKLVVESVANVVIFFALPTFALNFFHELNKLGVDRKFLWIASDGWAESQDIHTLYADEVAGMLGIVPSVAASQDFDNYFSQLTRATNKRNQWFDEYCDAYTQRFPSPDSQQKCTPQTYMQNLYVPTVIDAVYSAAHGLHNFLTENCDYPIVWNSFTQLCQGQKMNINGSVLFEYIMRVKFQSPTGRYIQYSKEGYVTEGTYEIKNLQKIGNVNNYTVVGKWNSSRKIYYNVPKNSWQFGLTNEGNIISILNSQCTDCQKGSVTLPLPSSCCNLCTQCLGKNYSNTSTATSCSICDSLMWGNNPLNGSDTCVAINQSFLSYQKPWGIALLHFQIIGLLTVTTIVVIIIILFLRNNSSIKNFGIVQYIIIFFGLLSCFILPLFFVLKPSDGVCAVQQLLLWLSLTIIFAVLLMKLIHITRDLLHSSGGQLWHFIEPYYQIIFTIIIVIGQMVLVVTAMAVTPPGPFYFQQNNTMDPNNFPELIVTCKQPYTVMLILQVAYESILIILINGLAIFTIRFPKNFNESRHIAFATFAIGTIWLAYIPTYVATSNEVRFASMALAVMAIGFAVMGCLIGPRLYTAFKTFKSEVSTEKSSSMHSRQEEFSLQQSQCKKEESTITQDKSDENESK